MSLSSEAEGAPWVAVEILGTSTETKHRGCSYKMLKWDSVV